MKRHHRAARGSSTTTPTTQEVQRKLDSVVAEIELAYDRIAAGRRQERSCLNCSNCIVMPSVMPVDTESEQMHHRLPRTVCKAGKWQSPGSILIHVEGRAGQLRGRGDCPAFRASN